MPGSQWETFVIKVDGQTVMMDAEGKNPLYFAMRADAESQATKMREADDVCFICGAMTSALAGNPAKWPLWLPYVNGNGKTRCYHTGCAAEVLCAADRRERLQYEIIKEATRDAKVVGAQAAITWALLHYDRLLRGQEPEELRAMVEEERKSRAVGEEKRKPIREALWRILFVMVIIKDAWCDFWKGRERRKKTGE
jgi:hypothetical protein